MRPALAIFEMVPCATPKAMAASLVVMYMAMSINLSNPAFYHAAMVIF